MDPENFIVFKTASGWLGVVSGGIGVKSLYLPRASRYEVEAEVRRRYGALHLSTNENQDLKHRLIQYFGGEAVEFNDSVDLTHGSEFSRLVWETVRSIPRGETRTYKEIAELICNPRSARAVGGALNANPVPIIVPCHRVVGSNGSLTGFAGGIDLKKKMLRFEGHRFYK
ncbi:methylated-DNA--[protein]-cysteine S-methyltransferase [Dehalococcoidia bacterium]|nr:methylated-DNA--[protein]-cysteine S-methyltransferase [Dehalococcoidia bacterium]